MDRRFEYNYRPSARVEKQNSLGRFARSAVVLAGAAAAVTASEKADVGPSQIDNTAKDSWNAVVEQIEPGPTSEQKKAEYLFSVTSDEKFVKDLVAVGDADDATQERIKVKMRTSPGTDWSDSDSLLVSRGHIKGELDLDAPITKAIPVFGEDPTTANRERAVWYAIKNNEGEVYFAFSGGFKGDEELAKIPPIDLNSVELPEDFK